MILASHGIIASQIQSFVGLLDLYPSAAAAYSLRKLRAAYTGSAIRVRRSSDNTETDILFVNNVLDTSTLTTFCSGTNGFVTTWYDQSGNGRNTTQSTASKQPQIVSSGSVLLKNGKSTLTFTAANANILNANFTQTITVQSSFAVAAINSASESYARIFTQGTNSNDYDANTYIPILRDILTQNFCSYINVSAASTAITYATQQLLSSIHTGSQLSNKVNNNTAVTFTNTLNFTAVKIAIGGPTPTSVGLGFLDGQIQEIVMYYSNQTSNLSGFQSNINSYYGIY